MSNFQLVIFQWCLTYHRYICPIISSKTGIWIFECVIEHDMKDACKNTFINACSECFKVGRDSVFAANAAFSTPQTAALFGI